VQAVKMKTAVIRGGRESLGYSKVFSSASRKLDLMVHLPPHVLVASDATATLFNNIYLRFFLV